MDRKISFLLISAFLLASIGIHAEPVIFDEIDTDGDGCISKGEASVRKDLVENFSDIDKDKSNTLCLDEYIAYENKGKFEPEVVETPELGAAPTE